MTVVCMFEVVVSFESSPHKPRQEISLCLCESCEVVSSKTETTPVQLPLAAQQFMYKSSAAFLLHTLQPVCRGSWPQGSPQQRNSSKKSRLVSASIISPLSVVGCTDPPRTLVHLRPFQNGFALKCPNLTTSQPQRACTGSDSLSAWCLHRRYLHRPKMCGLLFGCARVYHTAGWPCDHHGQGSSRVGERIFVQQLLQ